MTWSQEGARQILETLMACVPEGITIATGPEVVASMTSRYGDELLLGGWHAGTGLSMEEWLQRVEHYLPDGATPARVEDLPLWRAATRGEIVRDAEFVLRRPDGQRLVVLCNAAPLHDASGAPSGAVVVWRDITDRKATEARLAYVASFPEQNPSPIVEADAEGRIRYANPTALRLFPDIREKGGAHAFLSPWKDVVAAASAASSARFRFVTVGERTYHQVLAFPAGSSVVRVYGVDITDSKRAEAERDWFARQLQLALDAARMGWWHYDPVTRLATYDERCQEIFGMSGRQRPSEEILKLLHPDDLPRVWAAVEGALDPVDPKPYSTECRINHPDGTVRWVEGHGVAAFEGEGAMRRATSFVGTVADVTDRRRAEEALRETNAALRDADRRKDEFIGMLSHELRNPLAPIRNSVYVLRHADPASEQARRAQAVIERQSAHLTRLVDDLLEVTRIARGKIELRRERVDLRDVVRRTVDDFRGMFEDRGITLEVGVPSARAWADVDATRLSQVVGNLLQNSAKYSRPDDRVDVSLSVEGTSAEIRVRDTGAGIDPELLPRVFEPFVQGDRTLARTEGGLGLGLALVKGITELHGGTVSAESSGVGTGTTMTVRLPLAPPAVVGAEPRRAAARSEGACRVLVVDDNRDAAESLAELASMLGHVVEVAYDGASALETARDHRPDVVLCDLGMPGMSGYEVARALRASLGSAVRLVAVTGYAQPEDLARAIEAGFDAHVAKPADPAEIERLLVG